jgi:hypothetical protein
MKITALSIGSFERLSVTLPLKIKFWPKQIEKFRIIIERNNFIILSIEI